MKGILIDRETGDLLVKGGGLSIGDNESQVVEAVVMSHRGDFKEFPRIGGEIRSHLGGEADVMWPGRLLKQLRACGVECEKVTNDKGDITIW